MLIIILTCLLDIEHKRDINLEANRANALEIGLFDSEIFKSGRCLMVILAKTMFVSVKS